MSDPWIVTSPIAGTIVEVAVNVGDEADADTLLLAHDPAVTRENLCRLQAREQSPRMPPARMRSGPATSRARARHVRTSPRWWLFDPW